jgi:hypothetical protein
MALLTGHLLIPVSSLDEPCPHVRLVVIADQTGSAPENRIAPINETHIRSLLQGMAQCGGEMGIIAVTDDSRRPLVRVRVERFDLAPPQSPIWDSNPYLRRGQRTRFSQDSTKYEGDRQAWRARTDSTVNAFISRVRPILSRGFDAPRTDLCNALQRADIFLREEGTEAFQAHMLINSDGGENVRPRTARHCRVLPGTTEIAVVSGSGEIGVIEEYRHHLFESLESAIRWLNNRMRRS